jgi:hypothetical protein
MDLGRLDAMYLLHGTLPNRRKRKFLKGTALPEYVLPLALFTATGLILGANGAFNNLGQAALTSFGNAVNGNLATSNISIPSLGEPLNGGGQLSAPQPGTTPYQICDKSGNCITVNASTISAIETNGSLGTDDMTSLALLFQQLAQDFQNTRPELSSMLNELANTGLDIAANYNQALEQAKNPGLIGEYYGQADPSTPNSKNCVPLLSDTAAYTDCAKYNLAASLLTYTTRGGFAEQRYPTLAANTIDYMSSNSLLSPELISLLRLLTNEVQTTVGSVRNNYMLIYETQSKETVQVDSNNIKQMGLAITPVEQAAAP